MTSSRQCDVVAAALHADFPGWAGRIDWLGTKFNEISFYPFGGVNRLSHLLDMELGDHCHQRAVALREKGERRLPHAPCSRHAACGEKRWCDRRGACRLCARFHDRTLPASVDGQKPRSCA